MKTFLKVARFELTMRQISSKPHSWLPSVLGHIWSLFEIFSCLENWQLSVLSVTSGIFYSHIVPSVSLVHSEISPQKSILLATFFCRVPTVREDLEKWWNVTISFSRPRKIVELVKNHWNRHIFFPDSWSNVSEGSDRCEKRRKLNSFWLSVQTWLTQHEVVFIFRPATILVESVQNPLQVSFTI